MRLDDAALDTLFREARTYHGFDGRPVSEATLRELYDLLKWAPTSANSNPARFVFVRSPELRIDWRPFAYLSNHIDVRSARAETLVVEKLPAFRPVPDTGEPLLPDIDIDVRTLRVDRLIFEPAITGERRFATLSGKIAIADRRAQVTANAETIGAAGKDGAKGDKLSLVLAPLAAACGG